MADAAPVTDRDLAFYAAWGELLDWARSFAERRDDADFVKIADFPDYIYRMERPYDLPVIVMSASLSRPRDRHPVLLLTASPRHAVFKEVVVHPFDSHVYRHLRLAEDGQGLVEGRRPFDRQRFDALAASLFHGAAEPAGVDAVGSR